VKRTRTDKLLLAMTALFVGGLAVVAGAVSFAHMRELAIHHDQVGWESYAFPVSVDGLEVVASLYLVAQRRAGRPASPVGWVALVVGTLASLAANVAAGSADPIGKALAGWPAISMLVSVKLLFSMIDHTHAGQRGVPDVQRTSRAVPDVPGTVSPSGRDVRDAPADLRCVAHLVPAARAASATLAGNARPLSRDALAEAMRDGGHGVSNERASPLLKILKEEQDMTPPALTGTAAGHAPGDQRPPLSPGLPGSQPPGAAVWLPHRPPSVRGGHPKGAHG
jgi:Protein of unknown function (DUF2637)